ncbi:hypothetical protein B0H12DRAFT_1132852, partial [Mycena haematopus]
MPTPLVISISRCTTCQSSKEEAELVREMEKETRLTVLVKDSLSSASMNRSGNNISGF